MDVARDVEEEIPKLISQAGKIIWLVSRNSSRLGIKFPTKHLPNAFSQAGKLIWPLSGRTCGFGKAAWGESVHDNSSEGHKKHLACLATDVDQAVEEETPMNFARPDCFFIFFIFLIFQKKNVKNEEIRWKIKKK